MQMYRHPNISDERLRELFYERFGAPAVQGRIASTVSNIDEKRTEAITTRVRLERVAHIDER